MEQGLNNASNRSLEDIKKKDPQSLNEQAKAILAMAYANQSREQAKAHRPKKQWPLMTFLGLTISSLMFFTTKVKW